MCVCVPGVPSPHQGWAFLSLACQTFSCFTLLFIPFTLTLCVVSSGISGATEMSIKNRPVESVFRPPEDIRSASLWSCCVP